MKNQIINLKGHSGCSVVLVDPFVVRKTSYCEKYDNRLKAQMEKQIGFKHESIRTPSVLEYGYNEQGRFFFDMEYIRGRNLSSVFQKEPLSVCLDTIYKLEKIFPQNECVDFGECIRKKIKTFGNTINREYTDLVLSCDWNIPSGWCHGDLTFENIIISNGNLYLIDFLDSFVESPIVDQAKLLQDVFCYWSFHDGYIPKRKLIFVADRYNTKQHYCMLLIHLMRILPYADTKKKEIVTCMMNKVKIKINQF